MAGRGKGAALKPAYEVFGFEEGQRRDKVGKAVGLMVPCRAFQSHG